MDSLNAAQKRAVMAKDGPVVIIAGPGTGKTKTLTARIAYLVECGVRPDKILALTFTKKAAEVMRERYARNHDPDSEPTGQASLPANNPAGPAARSAPQKMYAGLRQNLFAGAAPPDVTHGFATAYISTFHALCFDLLTEKLGDAPQFITEPARLALIRRLSKPAVFKGMAAREMGLIISRFKNMADSDEAAAKLTRAYNAELAARNLADFDDLLVRTRDLLRADPAWLADVQARFDHILIDEFQDTNALQYDVLQFMRGTDNIFVIGDPLQSIYGFRGAKGGIFERFLHDFPQALHITLGTNYRSAHSVVRVANALYPHAPQLQAFHSTEGIVQAIEVLNEYSEAQAVLAEIQKTIGGSDFLRAVSNDERAAHRSLGSFAVIYRNRLAARALQTLFADSGLPYQVVGEGSPYDQPSVYAVLQIMARVADSTREVTIQDMTPRQIDALIRQLDASLQPIALAEQIIARCGFETDANMRQLCGVLVRFTSVKAAVAYFDELSTQQFYDPKAEAVTLLTIHAAKGLEFDHVFLIGAEEGILPSERGDTGEERRLFYVAATRAKERLLVLHAQYRGGKKATVSRFVSDLPASILPRMQDPALAADSRRAKKRQAKRAQTSFF